MSKHLLFLDPPSNENPLSSQLEYLTGDTYSTQNFRSVHDPKGLTASGVIENIDTGMRYVIPVLAHPEQKDPLACIKKLNGLAALRGGIGVFDHGDVPGPEHNYAKESLEALESLGLVERRGSDPSELLVQVTDLGQDACSAFRRYYRQKQKFEAGAQSPAP